jgi:hypothetical protein
MGISESNERPGSGDGFKPIGPVHRRLATLSSQANSANEEIASLLQTLEHTLVAGRGLRNLMIGADGCLYGLECGPIAASELVRLRSWLNRTLDGPANPSVTETFDALAAKYGPMAGVSTECPCLSCQTEKMLEGVRIQLEKDNPGARVEVVAFDFDAPLVKTGPGGDFTKEVCPSDLEVSRAAGVALRAMDRLADMVDRVKKFANGRTPAASAAKGKDAPGSPSDQ